MRASRVEPQYPPVPPVPAGTPRPRWSVMVPTYHCAGYLAQTLTSVLAQDPGPDAMEVVVVDDHSVRDDPGRVVQEVGGDRVRFVRQPRNVGHVRTFNTCLGLARGHWVHLLHGDDWVEDGFYAAADEAAAARPDLAAYVCRYRGYDDATGAVVDGPLLEPSAGVLGDWLARLGSEQRLQPPSIAVRRGVYERVGGFDLGVAGMAEDWEMWVRVAAAGPVWWDPVPRAVYRVRAGSLSDPSRLRAQMADYRRVHALNAQTLSSHLPPERVAACTRTSRRELALALLRRGRRLVGHGQRYPFVHAVEALKLWPRPRVLGGVALLTAARLRHLVRRTPAGGATR